MSYNDLLSKCEAAGAALVTSALPTGFTLLTGMDDDNLALPNLIVSAEDAGEEAFLGSGNHYVKLRWTVNESAEDSSLEDHRTNCAAVFDAVRIDDLDAQLSAALADFHVQGVRNVKFGRNKRDQVFSDYVEAEILACASDL